MASRWCAFSNSNAPSSRPPRIRITFTKTFLTDEFEREHKDRRMGDQISIINFCSLSLSKKMFDCWGSAQSTNRPISLKKNYLSHFSISFSMALCLCGSCWLVLKLWQMMMDAGSSMVSLGLILFYVSCSLIDFRGLFIVNLW